MYLNKNNAYMRLLPIFIGIFLVALSSNLVYAYDYDLTINGSYLMEDTFVNQHFPNSFFSSNNSLSVGNYMGTTDKMWTYLKFNLAVIPSNYVIDDASVCIYGSSGSDTAYLKIDVYPIIFNDTWTEATITWYDQPCGNVTPTEKGCTGLADSINVTTTGWVGEWRCFNVTGQTRVEYAIDKVIGFLVMTESMTTGQSIAFIDGDSLSPQKPRMYVKLTGVTVSPEDIDAGNLGAIDTGMSDPILPLSTLKGNNTALNAGLGLIETITTPIFIASVLMLVFAVAISRYAGEMSGIAFVGTVVLISIVYAVLGIYPFWILAIYVIIVGVVIANKLGIIGGGGGG